MSDTASFRRRIVFNAKTWLLVFVGFMALGLSVDVWMTVSTGSGLCVSTSCRVVGDYVRCGEMAMVQAGAVFFLLFWLLAFFYVRYPNSFWERMVSTALFGALAFDGALLGFQYVGLGERCQLCMAVGLGLMLILLQFSLVRRSFFIFILGLALWCSGFAANSVLKLDPVPPKIQETAFLTWPQELDPWEEYPAFHLFIGLHCGHCSKVLANLAVNDLEFFPWSFHLMDNREQDFVRIANILEDNSTRDNPFQAVLDVEKMSVHDLAPEVLSKDIRKKVENARDFFRFSGYQGVPMLIVDLERTQRVVLFGATAILDYLDREGLLPHRVEYGAPFFLGEPREQAMQKQP